VLISSAHLQLTPELFVPLALRATACENDVLTVICDEQMIRIINAHYGRLEATTCNANIGAGNTECLVDGTRDVVISRSVVDFCRVSVTQGCFSATLLRGGDHHITQSAS